METLNAWCIPSSAGVVRSCPEHLATFCGHDFDEKFDSDTLIYDAIFENAGVTLLCPKLFNLRSFLENCQYTINGVSCKPVFVSGVAFDKLVFTHSDAQTLVVSLDGFTKCYRRSVVNAFDNMKTIVTLSKNNDLRWIHDFALYYVKRHGAQALLFYDNDSTLYGVEDIAQVLRGTGLSLAKIVTVDRPYGPMLSNRDTSLMFLQRSLLHLAKHNELSRAHSVLSVDIDELVVPAKQTIFDAAKQHPMGLLRIPGRWRYADKASSYCHGAHHFMPLKPEYCPPKYCYVPNRALANYELEVHGLASRHSLLRKCLHSLCHSRVFYYWHMKALTTGWKGERSLATRSMQVDDYFVQTVADVFAAAGSDS